MAAGVPRGAKDRNHRLPTPGHCPITVASGWAGCEGNAHPLPSTTRRELGQQGVSLLTRLLRPAESPLGRSGSLEPSA